MTRTSTAVSHLTTAEAAETGIEALYAAAADLRRFTGPTGPDQLREILLAAGADARWLSGERWRQLADLWHRNADRREVSRVLVGAPRNQAPPAERTRLRPARRIMPTA